jgi:hypothetical protein
MLYRFLNGSGSETNSSRRTAGRVASTLYPLAVPDEIHCLDPLYVTGVQITISKGAEVMPRRYGETMHQLLEAIAEIQLHGVVIEEHGRLSTAQLKFLRKHLRMRAMRKKQSQSRGLDRMMIAGTTLGLDDGALDGTPTPPLEQRN